MDTAELDAFERAVYAMRDATPRPPRFEHPGAARQMLRYEMPFASPRTASFSAKVTGKLELLSDFKMDAPTLAAIIQASQKYDYLEWKQKTKTSFEGKFFVSERLDDSAMGYVSSAEFPIRVEFRGRQVELSTTATSIDECVYALQLAWREYYPWLVKLKEQVEAPKKQRTEGLYVRMF